MWYMHGAVMRSVIWSTARSWDQPFAPLHVMLSVMWSVMWSTIRDVISHVIHCTVIMISHVTCHVIHCTVIWLVMWSVMLSTAWSCELSCDTLHGYMISHVFYCMVMWAVMWYTAWSCDLFFSSGFVQSALDISLAVTIYYKASSDKLRWTS